MVHQELMHKCYHTYSYLFLVKKNQRVRYFSTSHTTKTSPGEKITNSSQPSNVKLESKPNPSGSRKGTPITVTFQPIASVVVERIPVVLPPLPKWELDYLEYREKRNAEVAKMQEQAANKRAEEELKLRAKKEKGKKKGESSQATSSSGEENELLKKMEKEIQAEEKASEGDSDIELPLITEFDKKNDRKSLYRKLTNRLYLIVKKPRKTNPWEFPQANWQQSDGVHLKNTAVNVLDDQVGARLKYWMVGNSPIGHYTLLYTEEAKKKHGFDTAKIFFYKAQYLHGVVKVKKDVLVDHLWVTRDELKEFFPEAYYNYVREMLLD